MRRPVSVFRLDKESDLPEESFRRRLMVLIVDRRSSPCKISQMSAGFDEERRGMGAATSPSRYELAADDARDNCGLSSGPGPLCGDAIFAAAGLVPSVSAFVTVSRLLGGYGFDTRHVPPPASRAHKPVAWRACTQKRVQQRRTASVHEGMVRGRCAAERKRTVTTRWLAVRGQSLSGALNVFV